MATPGQEQARLRALIRSEDRALELALHRATVRTLSAVHKLARSQRGAGPRLVSAWRRPPPRFFRRQMRARHGRAVAPGQASTIHFALKTCSGGKAAGEHQLYIEREEACVASFGNIAEEESERVRVWQEIEDRGAQRKGSIVLGPDAPQGLREDAWNQLHAWRDEGRIPPRLAAQMLRVGPEHWPVDGLRIWTHDDADHKQMADWLRGWENTHASQEEDAAGSDNAEGDGDDTEPVEAQGVLPGFEPPAGANTPSEPERERRKEERRRNAAKARKLPRGCREFLPRRTTVQRRLVIELAHELSLEAQERGRKPACGHGPIT